MRTADGDVRARPRAHPAGVVHPCQSVPTSVKKWRSTADSSGGGWATQPDTTRLKVWLARGSRSGDVGFGGGEMALEALEKPPFGAIFRQFSYGFHRVFRRPGPKARKLARIQPRKALVLSHVPLRTRALRSLTATRYMARRCRLS
jgi:hypothetical protein